MNSYYTSPVGQSDYICSGFYTFVVPFDVYSLCVLCVGGGGGGAGGWNGGYRGGGGGGGGLAYKNNIAVIPNTHATVFVGSGGSGGPHYQIGKNGQYSYFNYNGIFQVFSLGGTGGKYGEQSVGGDIVCGDIGHVGGTGEYGGYCADLNGGKAAGYVSDGDTRNVPMGVGIHFLGDGCNIKMSGKFAGGGGSGGVNGAKGEDGGDGVVRILWGNSRSFPSINTGAL